ncbi:uncharacterized protein LOC133788237 [Humulus lupulus]|uniref:uncharacterized protein LOC133788237 n=1 Tax=Humulus lupulus TaxID=3486 RepID=UPI002B40E5A6|nr:uncharacterized protein LOC133788237 [Humulus lupulus]
MCKWLLGDMPNKTPRDVKTGSHGPAWFLTLKTPQSWLNDGHIDASEHMLCMRRKYFPNIYRQNAVVMNNYFSQVIPARYDQYKQTADKTKYYWDADIMSMLTGIEQQFLASWGGVEDVYWCQNYGQQHWFAIEASISSWTLTVYDSENSVISDAKLEDIMSPWCFMLPSLLMQSKLFTDSLMLKIPSAGNRPHRFTLRRKQKHELPKSKRSGDCGVYAIKYIEHLMVGLPLETICDENMEVFRNKWTTDLWYQNLLP